MKTAVIKGAKVSSNLFDEELKAKTKMRERREQQIAAQLELKKCLIESVLADLALRGNAEKYGANPYANTENSFAIHLAGSFNLQIKIGKLDDEGNFDFNQKNFRAYFAVRTVKDGNSFPLSEREGKEFFETVFGEDCFKMLSTVRVGNNAIITDLKMIRNYIGEIFKLFSTHLTAEIYETARSLVRQGYSIESLVATGWSKYL